MALLQIHPTHPQKRLIEKVSEVIDNGGVIAYPTDTAYGLAADIFNKKAVEKLYWIKKTAPTKLFSCICYDFSKLSEYAHISTQAYRIMKHLLPGPYTFILEGKTRLPKITLTKRKTIGVRMPRHPIAEALYWACKNPLLSCGVRLDGAETLNDPAEIHQRLKGAVELVVDGGPVPYSPSSVVSLIDDQVEIIRRGSGDLSYFGGADGE